GQDHRVVMAIGRFFQRLCATTDQSDLPAFLQKQPCRGAADAARGPGYDNRATHAAPSECRTLPLSDGLIAKASPMMRRDRHPARAYGGGQAGWRIFIYQATATGCGNRKVPTLGRAALNRKHWSFASRDDRG